MNGIFRVCTYWKQLFVLPFALLSFILSTAQNPIVTENLKAGSPSSEWDLPDKDAGDLSIQGFATDISVNRGDTIRFKIKTDAPNYTITIYRLGYYQGLGARKITSDNSTDYPLTHVIKLTHAAQPEPVEDAITGITDCGNWFESAKWGVPDTVTSGIYIAKLTRTDNSGSSHIAFVVRDDASHSKLFFQTSDATWQAYNEYGGNSLYVAASSLPNGHASKVSYNRPFITRNHAEGQDWLFNSEYPMIRFLEKNGYDMTYTTNIDGARNGSLILNHQVFMSVGHDEYWSAEQRASVEAARAAGVHLAFFSGNEVYWKTRWENSVDPSGTPFRTLVCYKEGDLGEMVCNSKCDPNPTVWTGLWRTGGAYDAGRPENALSGQISWDGSTGAIVVPSEYKNLRFWRHTDIPSMGSETQITLPDGTLGYEWNWEQYPESYPSGRITMSNTTLNGKTHKLSLYRHSSGALVFGAGTVQWAWGLDDNHDRGNTPPDIRMQQATVNVLKDMGVDAETLQNDLIAPTQSTDVQAPVTLIASPAHAATVSAGSLVVISGTASDNAVVAGVEVSIDGGSTWHVATGTTNWTYNWVPSSQGVVAIKVRGFDDSGNMEAAGTAPSGNAINVTVGPPLPPVCPCTIFQPTDVPATTADDHTAVELGVKFRSSVNGYITGIRFYKVPGDNGTHTGTLWTLNGQLLAQGVFSNETAGGWQQMNFGAPVAITAGVTYVASYHNPTGNYGSNNTYFATPHNFNGGPLTGIAATDPDGPNGMYKYTPVPAFPTDNFQASNYWVDAVFDTTLAADVVPPTVLSTQPLNGVTGYTVNGTIQVNFNEAIDPASLTSTNFELRDAANNVIPGTISYNAAISRATLTPSGPLAYSTSFTATVKGGTGGVTDVAGNALAVDYSFSFTSASAPSGPPNVGPGGPILVISSPANPFGLYAAEILRAQGMNEFAVTDITSVTPAVLNNYDVVVLGEMPLSAAQATMFSDWTTAGGTFIAFRPDADLAGLLGITPAGGTLANKYLAVNTATAEGSGIVSQTIQFHGTADLYTLNGASSLATLYSSASTATTNPAVTIRSVGANGGKAIAFTYDLARSIVYTRQGNPAWAGQKRDGQAGPIRSDDMFFGISPEPDWIDFNKIAIPQADEQQHLLTNIIIKNNLHRKPLPKFWFLPRKLKAAIVMTGDDHNVNGTTTRFDQYLTMGPNTPQDVADWKAVRATSYMYSHTPIGNAAATAYEAQGFEIALHPNTGCLDYTFQSLNDTFTTQLADFAANYPGLHTPVTNRTHCLAWSDWASHAKVEALHGVRLDANYYYWPGAWVQDRAGMFTGSGLPMRFADTDGSMIDVYQLTTQMPDESNISSYTSFVSSLLDKALGSEGYYGVFTTNMHMDFANHPGSDEIVAAALARQVPVISARQMQQWLDGRNGSSFSAMAWNGTQLSFTVNALADARNLQGMLPLQSVDGQLTALTRDGSPATFTVENIKGISYAFFDATNGDYVATYSPVTLASITGTVVLQGRPAAPNDAWKVPVKVDLYASGNTTTPLFTYNVTTNESGVFTISNIPAGTYTIAVKGGHTLRRVKANQVLTIGNNALNFGTLLEGDANNDNVVDEFDVSVLINTIYKILGEAGYDARADFNSDNIIDEFDISALINNIYQVGENP